jgi:hypothetical protein
MAAKVEGLLDLVGELPGLKAHILSGERPGALQAVLAGDGSRVGGTLVEGS